MNRRRNEITAGLIDLQWPHQVEVVATICEGRKIDEVYQFCRRLSAAPRGGRRVRLNDVEYLRFAFSLPADADAFQARFGGHRLTAAKESGRWTYRFHRT